MDKSEIPDRITALRAGLAKVREEYKRASLEVKRLEGQELIIIGQITEREMELEERPAGHIGKLPVFETQEELEEALAKRGKGPLGENPETIAEQREHIYQREAHDAIEFIDNEQKGL